VGFCDATYELLATTSFEITDCDLANANRAAQERAEKLTIKTAELAATKILPALLIAAI
jgi:hypothetical protein